jgi:hypothetical protein
MRDGLDDIDWGALRDAYGPATRVPAWLCEAMSPLARNRDVALAELFGALWHQGTIYSASVAALPFLFGMLTSGAAPDTASLAALAAAIVGGSGYYEVHALGQEQRIDARLRKDGTTLQAVLQEEQRVVAAARAVAASRLGLLLPFLSNADADVRMAVGEALAKLPSEANETLAPLRQALERETDEQVAERLQRAIDALS